MKIFLLLTVLATIALTLPTTGAQDNEVIYFNNFESSVGSEWSRRSTDTTPRGERTFLGQFRNQTATLTIDDLPSHKTITISFDLYILNSWDGNRSEVRADREGNRAAIGPDIWNLSIANGSTLLSTTFTTVDEENFPQAYPDNFPGGTNAAYSDTAEQDTLGYPFHGDAVYHLAFTFLHSASSLALNFSASGLQPGASDESWGLDNVELKLSESSLVTIPIDFNERNSNLTFNLETCAIENGANFFIYEILRFYGELGRISDATDYANTFVSYFAENEGGVEQLRKDIEQKLLDIAPTCDNSLHYLIGTRQSDMSSLGNISYGFFQSLVTYRGASGSYLATLLEHISADILQRFNRETLNNILRTCGVDADCILIRWGLQGDEGDDRVQIQIGRALAEGFLLYGTPITPETLIILGNEFGLSL